MIPVTLVRQHRSWKHIYTLAALASMMITVFLTNRTASNNSFHNKKKSNNTRTTGIEETGFDSDHLPCTFEQLLEAFPPTAAVGLQSSENSSKNESGTVYQNNEEEHDKDCWKLEEEILRVPVSAIQGPTNLTSLGKGNFGNVYLATIDVQTSAAPRAKAKRKFCNVALKSDFCKLVHSTSDSEDVSCLDSRSVERKTSLMATEYTGALVSYATSKGQIFPSATRDIHDASSLSFSTRHVVQDGYLPTWGVVQRTNRNIIPSDIRVNAPNSDPSIIAVLLPLVRFQVLSEVDFDELQLSAANVAEMFLPLARALAFRMDLGLVHQDMMVKNMGFLETERRAFLFDNSFTAVYYNETRFCGKPCNFCHEDEFEKGVGLKRDPWPFFVDLIDFTRILVDHVLPTCTDKLRSSEVMHQIVAVRDAFTRPATAHDLVRVLEQFASK